MSYIARPITLGTTVFRAFGWLPLAVLLAFLALTAPVWLRSKTVEYIVYPGPRTNPGAVGTSNARTFAGCEIYGKVLKKDGEKVIRYRFPNDPELEQCFLDGVPPSSRTEKVTLF